MRGSVLNLALLLLAPLAVVSAQEGLELEVGGPSVEMVTDESQLRFFDHAVRDSIAALFLVPPKAVPWSATDTLGAPQQEQQHDTGHTRTTLALVLVLALVIVIGVSTTSISPN